LNRTGKITDPCGTPAGHDQYVDRLVVTFARKLLPHPQAPRNQRQRAAEFSVYMILLCQEEDVRRDYFDVLKYIMVHDSSKGYIVNCKLT
jgi:hypothetical protein